MTNRARAARALAATAVAFPLVLAACRDRPGGSAGSGPFAEEVARAVPLIEKQTGLKFKTPPKVEARSKDEVRSFLLRQFEEEEPKKDLAGEEAAYKLLGVIPEDMDLRKFLVDLLTEQIVGLYDPRQKTLYVVSGDDQADQTVVNTILTHELVHALQDQYVNLDSIMRQRGDADRQTAAQAVIEGQATFDQIAIMVGGDGDISSRLPGGWDRVRQMIRENQAQSPIFSTAPTLIQEALIFPYLSGADFVRRAREKKPGVNVLDSIPTSTEQIWHTDAFFGTARDEPTRVTLPAPSGGTVVHNSNVGEFGVRIMLYEHTKDATSASRAAAGWDGDRYVVVNTPQGNAIAWLTVWDTPLDAAEFTAQLEEGIRRRLTAAAPTQSPSGARRYSARGRTVDIRHGEIGGRTVVLYVDAPSADLASSLVSFSGIRLGQ